MSRLVTVPQLLALALCGLLLVSLASPLSLSVSAFSPYDTADDIVSGEVPQTSTLECTTDPATGEQVCTSVASTVPDEEEIALKAERLEREREERQAAKEAARKARQEKLDAEREAKRLKRQQEAEKRRKAEEEGTAQNDGKQRHDKDHSGGSKLNPIIKRMKISYYKFFGVDEDAPKLKIRKAANQMALESHPDKCPDRHDAKCIASRKEKMIIINEAREVLLNDEKRAKYDMLLNFGFKVYDEELYEDIKYQLDNDLEVDVGWWENEGYDPSTDPFESMDLTEESAGWILLGCAPILAGFIIWPLVKFWDGGLDAAKRKEKLLASMKQSKKIGEQVVSMKKKTERYTGDKTIKRFAPVEKEKAPTQPERKAANGSTSNGTHSDGTSSNPSSSNKKNNDFGLRNRTAKSTAAVAILCIIGLFASSASSLVAAAPSSSGNPLVPELHVSYYDLLEVPMDVDARTLKKA